MSFSYSLTKKTVPDPSAYLGALQAVVPAIFGFTITIDAIVIESSQEIYGQALTTLDAITPPSTPINLQVQNVIKKAMEFGNQILIEFAAENVLLGITQAGMTTAVRNATARIVSALQTGSLYDAINECRAVPAQDKDATFVTDARLLLFVNKIEVYLGLPVSTQL